MIDFLKEPRSESSPRVLIVDDEPDLVEALADALSLEGFDVQIAYSAEDAIGRLSPGSHDAIVSDLNMPGMQGDEFQRVAHGIDPTVPLMILTAASDVSKAVECLKSGACDYVVKPFDVADLSIRLDKALEKRQLALLARELELENDAYRLRLEAQVREQREELRTIFGRALRSFAQALEAKDPNTQNHSARVAGLSLLLAEELRAGPAEFLRSLVTGALLHDIGKIGIPEPIILSPGKLTDEEFEIIKRHPLVGEAILKPIYSNDVLLKVVRHHHEAFDGSGYPDGLVGEAIPFGARIVAVADAYDAMTSARSYRSAMSQAAALEVMRRGAGKQWDAEIVLTLADLGAEGKLDVLPDIEYFFGPA